MQKKNHQAERTALVTNPVWLQEEYEKMKAAFDVEEEGFDEDQDDTSEGQLQAFIQHIKVRSGFRKMQVWTLTQFHSVSFL